MKIKSVEKVSDYPYLNLFSIRYTDRVRQEKEYIFASRSPFDNPLTKKTDLPDAVVVVPFHTDENKLVLIEEYRLALGGFQYGFPAGLLDEGESVEQAGARELFEETGLTVTRVIKQSPAVFSSSGMTDESVSLLFVHCTGTPTDRFTEASEQITVRMLSQEDAAMLLMSRDIQFDVKSWTVLNYFSQNGNI
jgi:ADP-ribose pyrophosphatase